MGLSNARAILLATILCASGDVAGLPRLHARFPKSLSVERLLRMILTFLPESSEPRHYTSAIQRLADGSADENGDDIDVSAVENVSEAAAREQVRRIRLLPLRYRYDEEEYDTLDQFLIHRAHLIDSETGLQPLILDLLLPFCQRSTIRTWLISSLLPLLRLNYEYCPESGETLSLETLESMDNSTAVNVLLSVAGRRMDLTKNLRGLVGPWLHGSERLKRRRRNEIAHRNSISLPQDDQDVGKSSGWQTVNEWLLSRYLIDREIVANAFATWNGPEDVDLGGYDNDDDDQEASPPEAREVLQVRYYQTGLAMIYANADPSKAALDDSIRVLARVASLCNMEEARDFDPEFISSCSGALLLQNALLLPSNNLTQPSISSISFLGSLLTYLQTLSDLGYPIPCRTGANICLYDNQDLQRLELETIISSVTKYAMPGRDWRKVREQLLSLRSEENYCGLFWRVPKDTMEMEILKSLLAVRGRQNE